MPWYSPWSDLLKKKVCRYLLQRYLGQFLEEKLSLEQLNVDLYNGRGTVYNVALYSEALNELCESQGWGIEVTGGRIGSVTVTIPWNALMTDDSYIEVSDLYMSIRPLARQTDGTSMLESMWSSVSSSIQLAQECLEKEGDENTANAQNATIEGLEKFAQTIDNDLLGDIINRNTILMNMDFYDRILFLSSVACLNWNIFLTPGHMCVCMTTAACLEDMCNCQYGMPFNKLINY